MKTILQKFCPIFLLIVFFCPSICVAQEESSEEKKSVFDLFFNEEGDPTEIEIAYNFALLDSLKNKDVYQDANLSVIYDKKNKTSWNIRLKARGKYRRRICDFPPIKLKFEKEELAENGLKKHNDYKLVTHCLNDYQGRENVLREYLTYQLYQVYSERYFRTQLVKVKYIDSQSNKKFSRLGIIIEDEETVAKRLEGKVCDECFSTPKDSFQLENVHTAALFQYMIGNADWSIMLNRNLKIMRCKITDTFFLVPYDFDFSGLVNASYAIPNSDYGHKSIRERVFLGFSDNPSELKPYTEKFIERKDEAYKLVKGFKKLSSTSRKDILDYLDTFYASLKDNSFETGLIGN